MPAARLVPLPDGIPAQQAAAMMLQGMTAQYLLRSTYRVQPGDTILFHAAAGGVGLIACQWAKHLGATVIGTAGGPAKVDLALAHGADHVIDYTREDFVARVKELTGGTGVPVVYNSVGKDTFLHSLDCLRMRGLLVSFGQSSGAVPPFDPGILSAKGSLYLTRPTLCHYTAAAPNSVAARRLFEVVKSGAVKIEVNQTYPSGRGSAGPPRPRSPQDHRINGFPGVIRSIGTRQKRGSVPRETPPLFTALEHFAIRWNRLQPSWNEILRFARDMTMY